MKCIFFYFLLIYTNIVSGGCLKQGDATYTSSGPYGVNSTDVLLPGKFGAYKIYYPVNVDPLCPVAFVAWVNGGGVTGYGAYQVFNQHVASWGMVVIASGSDPTQAKSGGQSQGLHVPAINYMINLNNDVKSKFYHRWNGRVGLSGHSGGAGSAVLSSASYDGSTVVSLGGGGIPGIHSKTLAFTGTKDANPPASYALYESSSGPTFLANYQGGNHVDTETAAGWSPNNPYHAGTVQLVRVMNGWFRCYLDDDVNACNLFKNVSLKTCGICLDKNWAELKGKNL